MDLEKKMLQMHKNSVYILILSAIIALASIGILFTTSARFNAIDNAIVFINDNSLAQIQEDVRLTNDNVLVTNDNLGVLQENILYSMNVTSD